MIFPRNINPQALRELAGLLSSLKVKGLAFTLNADGSVKILAGKMPPEAGALVAALPRAAAAAGKQTPPIPSPAAPVAPLTP